MNGAVGERVLLYTVSSQDGGRRLQDFLMKRHGYSVRLIRRLKQRDGAVLVGEASARMIDRVLTGDRVTVTLPPDELRSPDGLCRGKTEREGTSLSVPIAYEDEDVIVYNKPPFLAMHPCRDHQRETLAEVFYRDMRERGAEAPVFRPVYRLDRDTDGLCVVAKNPLAAATLAKAIQKEYTAIACGWVDPSEGTVDAPIAQLAPHRMKRGVREDGQRAVTHYHTLGRFPTRPEEGGNRYTLLRLRLETGRTHQIRVHFAHMGYPLAGDAMYGGAPAGLSRQALSCTWVSFRSSGSGKHCEICINMQRELTNLLLDE